MFEYDPDLICSEPISSGPKRDGRAVFASDELPGHYKAMFVLEKTTLLISIC